MVLHTRISFTIVVIFMYDFKFHFLESQQHKHDRIFFRLDAVTRNKKTKFKKRRKKNKT